MYNTRIKFHCYSYVLVCLLNINFQIRFGYIALRKINVIYIYLFEKLIITLNYTFSPKQKFAQTSVGAMAKVASIDELRFRTKYDGYVNIHPSSVVARSDKGGHPVLKILEFRNENYLK